MKISTSPLISRDFVSDQTDKYIVAPSNNRKIAHPPNNIKNSMLPQLLGSSVMEYTIRRLRLSLGYTQAITPEFFLS